MFSTHLGLLLPDICCQAHCANDGLVLKCQTYASEQKKMSYNYKKSRDLMSRNFKVGIVPRTLKYTRIESSGMIDDYRCY